MSSIQLQHTIFQVLPQLSEVQLYKLLEFINHSLVVQKPQVASKPALEKMREIKIFTDGSFRLDMPEIHVALPFSNTFVVRAKVGAVERLKPVVIL